MWLYSELATQIAIETKKFAKPVGLKVVPIFGGAGIGEQIAMLKVGAEIIVATPGRLIDILCANSGMFLLTFLLAGHMLLRLHVFMYQLCMYLV
jgi:superfamily II DNA/RNA helicase